MRAALGQRVAREDAVKGMRKFPHPVGNFPQLRFLLDSQDELLHSSASQVMLKNAPCSSCTCAHDARGSLGTYSGSSTCTQVPVPRVLRRVMWPPCCSTICLAIASPSPVPCALVLKNG